MISLMGVLKLIKQVFDPFWPLRSFKDLMCLASSVWCAYMQHPAVGNTGNQYNQWDRCDWGRNRQPKVLFACPNYVEDIPRTIDMCRQCRKFYQGKHQDVIQSVFARSGQMQFDQARRRGLGPYPTHNHPESALGYDEEHRAVDQARLAWEMQQMDNEANYRENRFNLHRAQAGRGNRPDDSRRVGDGARKWLWEGS